MKIMNKVVKKYGNSGGVYVPSSWIGGKVKVELIDEPVSPKDVLNKINLEHVASVVLCGSYARNEIEEGSDIDIILITDEDAQVDVPDELKQKCDIQSKTMEEARSAMMHDPVFHKLIMDESVALINHRFLDTLKKEKLRPGGITTRTGLAESSIGIIKELFESGSDEMIYPVVMRLKEMLILEYLLTNKKYSTAALKNEILRCGISKKEFFDAMNIYRAARNNKKPEKYRLSKETSGKLISLLESKIRHVKKEAEKRN